MFKIFPLVVIVVLSSFSFAQTPVIEPGVSHDLAIWRAARYSDVRYKLNLTLEKMSPVLKGTIEIHVKLRESKDQTDTSGYKIPPDKVWISAGTGEGLIMLDWRKIRGHEDASTISNVTINGVTATELPMNANLIEAPDKPTYTVFSDHLIFWNGVPGENVIKLDFTSPILTSGSAITRYVDKEDGAEYIYSLFVPSDASTAFPVFDQPDLKARFTLSVVYPKGWLVVSATQGPWELTPMNGTPPTYADNTILRKDFPETKPISSYTFAFAAGPFTNFREDLKDFQVDHVPADEAEQRKLLRSLDIPPGQNPSFIYLRKSQAAKFKPHAAEVFRLEREAVKYLETYFDYKFPFPKYDLVLIPEFPFGGMEHAGATFLRESSVIFPSEPTKSDYISRATLIFHETAHQWFGDTVTMKWFDDLWLKEGFANFMAYKAMEKIMPEMNAWKVFYERIKQPAYATDSTKGTTPIYQPIANLSAAKSAYGNIVYNKAPAFLRQAEFYLGEDKFQTAVRAFLKKHEFANAGWEDLVKEFETASGQDLKDWANVWVKEPGMPVFRVSSRENGFVSTAKPEKNGIITLGPETIKTIYDLDQTIFPKDKGIWWRERLVVLTIDRVHKSSPTSTHFQTVNLFKSFPVEEYFTRIPDRPSDVTPLPEFIFPNYQDYGYGIFLLDDKSRDYVLKNVQNEKDPFLRSMMYGELWDSVREAELDPREYVELVIKNLPAEQDENITASVLGRVGTAMNYYLSDKQRDEFSPRLEKLLIEKMQNAPTLGQRITFYRSFLNAASSESGRALLKDLFSTKLKINGLVFKAKDRFDIITRLAILGDPDAPKRLADLEKTETSDDAKRYAYAAEAAFATKENREKFWNDFVGNKTISESWIEAAVGPFNSIRHDDLSVPYLQRALAELPNLKRDRKIFFVNGWLGAFIGGQKSQEALDIVNKFLADNPNLDNDLRLKILENVDLIERAVKIRGRYATR